MPTIKCPECGSDIGIKKIGDGNSLKTECPECFVEMRVRCIGNQLFVEKVEEESTFEHQWEADDYDETMEEEL